MNANTAPDTAPNATAAPPHTHATREAWLQAAISRLRPWFAAKGYTVPPCQVSCGFASSGVRSGHIGQCWSRRSSPGGINQVFISPALTDVVEVLDTLVHELVHAVDDCEHKHGPEFKKIALAMGLKGPMRSATTPYSRPSRRDRWCGTWQAATKATPMAASNLCSSCTVQRHRCSASISRERQRPSWRTYHHHPNRAPQGACRFGSLINPHWLLPASCGSKDTQRGNHIRPPCLPNRCDAWSVVHVASETGFLSVHASNVFLPSLFTGETT